MQSYIPGLLVQAASLQVGLVLWDLSSCA